MTDRGFLEVPGARLAYEADGAGPPLILIHAGVANLRMWDAQVPVFAADHHVIRYDTRGWGISEAEHVEFSNRADVAAMLDHFDAPRAVVLGLSRGGGIALDFTIEYPDRVAALIVAAGGVSGYEAPLPEEVAAARDAFAQASDEAWQAKDWHRLADMETEWWVDGPGQPADRVDPELRALVHGWILTTYAAEKEEGLPTPIEPPAAGRLHEVRVPTLVMAGALDDAGTTAACRHLAESVDGARFEPFEETAHMINLERPERFNQLVGDFLAEIAAS